MNRKWNAIATTINLNADVHFEHNVDGSVNLHSDHMDAINTTLEANASSLQSLQGDNEKLTAQVDEHKASIDASKTQIDELNAKVAQLETDLSASADALATVNADLLAAKDVIARRPVAAQPILNNMGGADDTSFADKVKDLPHNIEADKILK